jgi:hypothetical protein
LLDRSIRTTEPLTGVNRNTIMRLLLIAAANCTRMMRHKVGECGQIGFLLADWQAHAGQYLHKKLLASTKMNQREAGSLILCYLVCYDRPDFGALNPKPLKTLVQKGQVFTRKVRKSSSRGPSGKAFLAESAH